MSQLSRLPKRTASRVFPTHLTAGFNHAGAMVSSLGKINHRNQYQIMPGVDTSKVLAKRIRTFSPNEYLLGSLNTWLGGGNSYPYMTAFLGIGLGTVSAPAGIMWSVFSASMDSAKSNNTTQCFAREADQLWLVEAAGLENRDAKLTRQVWLVDPLRNGNSGPPASSWCIAEDRYELLA